MNFKGNEHYRIRFLPEEAGLYRYTVVVFRNGSLIQSMDGKLTVAENVITYHGRLKVDTKLNRNFIFEDGKTFIPVGENVCWYTNQTRKTYDYDNWFSKMSACGINTTRIWLATWGFCLHWGKRYDEYRLDAAARLDRVVALSEENDLYFMLTLLNHGQFSAKVNAEWEKNPWSKANGGILDYPNQFFTSEEAKAKYKNELLYIIGRWGYCNHIMAWELWNEVTWTDDYRLSDAGYLWHEEMSKFVKENDPYHHMVTTSLDEKINKENNIATIDYANPHSYNFNDKNIDAALPDKLEWYWDAYHKPVFHSEIGVNWQNGTGDPHGVTLRQQNWAGIMGGSAGCAMNWWWDSLVHPNLYHCFTGAAKFAKQMDMTGSSYQQLRLNPDVKLNNDQVGILGYNIDNRIYAYLFDKTWKHTNPKVEPVADVTVELPLSNGTYFLRVFDTVTGSVIRTETLKINDGKVQIKFNTLLNEAAFIIE